MLACINATACKGDTNNWLFDDAIYAHPIEKMKNASVQLLKGSRHLNGESYEQNASRSSGIGECV